MRRGRAATVAAIVAVVAVMGGITSYSVTLYRLFCQVTGANGTTQRVARDDAAIGSREVTVFFDTTTAPNLPWRFAPVQRSVRVKLGEQALVFFRAENDGREPIVGHATFNVTPEKAGLYFKKIQCFCFNEERLAPGERVEMPVTFFVDPAIAHDPNTADVQEITLAYTFFRSIRPDGAKDLARFDGAKVFAENCSGCHALDRAKIGPPLGGLAGRRAGSVAGYAYSAALAGSGVVWDRAALDRWLADPGKMVPGTAMQARVEDGGERAALARFLIPGADDTAQY